MILNQLQTDRTKISHLIDIYVYYINEQDYKQDNK